jgi:hypothetical protein
MKALAGIKLNESVTAVPGIGVKEDQTAWSSYNEIDEAQVDTCNQDNPENADKACAMEEEIEECEDEMVEENFDLNNGYDDTSEADAPDYFPNGADSPVTKDVGPSGARQGDNPEQKKMQVDEVHKELVYGYRNFLQESAQKKK